MPARRIVAVVLPELLCEVAFESLQSGQAPRSLHEVPLAVVLDTQQTTARLDAVNRVARRYGVTEGQTVVEANAFLTQLVVRTVSREKILAALARVAEVAMAFGSLVSIESEAELSDSRSAPDTIWVDITGSAHLRGGEHELAEALEEQVRALGHVVRVAVASGKLLAQAFARWSRPSASQRALVVPEPSTKQLLAELPVVALPLEKESAAWLVRLGVFSVAELMALPRKSAVSRLGVGADRVLDLCAGKDTAPLVAYQPPRKLVEERFWEQPVDGIEPLIFALRGLASRISARLAGRGEAAQLVELTISLDRSIAELRQVPATLELTFELASPLWKERDLSKVLLSRLERLTLGAPSLGVRWVVPKITRAAEKQLDLSRVAGGSFAGTRGLEDLPVLLAELNADIGQSCVGVLALRDEHRPELQSQLVPALAMNNEFGVESRKPKRSRSLRQHQRLPRHAPVLEKPRLRKVLAKLPLEEYVLGSTPTRLLPVPVQITAPLKRGATLSLGAQIYLIEQLSFEQRLEAIHWWQHPVRRDYFKVNLKGSKGRLEALVYVERDTKKRYLQAIAD